MTKFIVWILWRFITVVVARTCGSTVALTHRLTRQASPESPQLKTRRSSVAAMSMQAVWLQGKLDSRRPDGRQHAPSSNRANQATHFAVPSARASFACPSEEHAPGRAGLVRAVIAWPSLVDAEFRICHARFFRADRQGAAHDDSFATGSSYLSLSCSLRGRTDVGMTSSRPVKLRVFLASWLPRSRLGSLGADPG